MRGECRATRWPLRCSRLPKGGCPATALPCSERGGRGEGSLVQSNSPPATSLLLHPAREGGASCLQTSLLHSLQCALQCTTASNSDTPCSLPLPASPDSSLFPHASPHPLPGACLRRCVSAPLPHSLPPPAPPPPPLPGACSRRCVSGPSSRPRWQRRRRPQAPRAPPRPASPP